ncbi:MAG: hypothetical protein HYR94_28915 [Chloroflexi bacterium]|nr:hypothetical protein [Chloroflexota bacterium]
MEKSALILIAICLTAFVAITLLSDRVAEHVPHSEDEVAYIFQAKVFAQNRLAVPTPGYRQAFWTPFVVDYQGQRFGKYPPGWPFLLSLGVRLNAPWLVNTLLATLTLALIARLGDCFYRQDPKGLQQIGLCAAGLGLVTPGFLFLSSSLLSHTASLFWSTLALVALFHATEHSPSCVLHLPLFLRNTQDERREILHASRFRLHALLAGLTFGAAFVTRPFAGVGIGLAVGIFLLVLIIRGEINWTVLLWIVLGGLLVAILSPLYWWVITGDPAFNAYLLIWPYDRVGFGPDVGPYGYTLSDAIFINTRLKLTALATGLFGWPGWSNLLFIPLPFLARRANRWDWLLLGTILSLIFVHVFYWSFGGADGGFPRYYYDALPAFLLLTVRGIQVSGDILARWQKQIPLPQREGLGEGENPAQQRHYWSKPTPSLTLPLRGGGKNLLRWLPAGLVIIFIGYNLIWNLPPLLAAQKGKYGIMSAQLQAVERANLPTPALVIVKNVEKWSDFAAPFAANSPTLDGPVVYASDEGAEVTQALQKQFEERTCWELDGENLRPCK